MQIEIKYSRFNLILFEINCLSGATKKYAIVRVPFLPTESLSWKVRQSRIDEPVSKQISRSRNLRSSVF